MRPRSAAERQSVGLTNSSTTKRSIPTRIPLKPRLPIARLPSIVSDCKNADVIRYVDVHDVIGKSRHGTSSHWQIGGQPRHECTSPGHFYDPIDSRIDRIDELNTEIFAP